ncbi:aminotransferase class III-fold pyridoxal phosphate-dependent enzyme [Cryptosporangium minutisporangium]|uniref:Aminotransferase class III-fold pyridoxal phosphate-dependent enzyme n=2 Tax=Cryptosporangium minutisporangium TaxID=113569 RepID=A0ABP6SVJ5_9ACTN
MTVQPDQTTDRVAELAAALSTGGFPWASKDAMLSASEAYWNPGKTRFWIDEGVPLVIDRREGYHLHDVAGHTLIDVHLNGGTYNLGHRNPDVVAAVTRALDRFDVGNHHFPSLARTALAEALIRTAPPGLAKVVYGSGGGEAVDIAIKSARHATKRRKIVSIVKAYHGHTGLAVGTGDDRFSRMFLADQPADFPHVEFNDLGAMADALRGDDVAAVIMETIPATYGFPMPAPGYLAAVKRLCEEHGTLYIADEVQTGLGRTGELWGITKHHVEPDLLITGKGLSGGIYPVTAVLASDRAAAWLDEDGFGHISTFGGAELGCVAALTALDLTLRRSTRENVAALTELFADGLASIRAEFPDWLVGIRQDGLVIGLEFAHSEGAKHVMRRLYQGGVWAIFSTLDPRVLQYKPGLLVTPELAADILEHTRTAVRLSRDDVR